MILSFHPIFEGDKNIICAGRDPDDNDLAAVKTADAVILPQGCRQSLYEMARNNCVHVFPNYDAKFKYPGKVGQIHLFQETNVPHPKTRTCPQTSDIRHQTSSLSFPFVFKFDWGGEGDNVFLIKSIGEFQDILEKADAFEKTGQTGSLIQEYIPFQNKTLRVVVIGETILSYWRIQENTKKFCVSLAEGAIIDAEADPESQAEAMASVRDFCKKTGINLAGFDFLFSSSSPPQAGKQEDESGDEMRMPLFLEINYFFGRRGLGGSERFYELLEREIRKWIDTL